MWSDDEKNECRRALWLTVEKCLRISNAIDSGAAAMDLQPMLREAIGALERADMAAADAAFAEVTKKRVC